jgi:large subunit ribosomal protein L4
MAIASKIADNQVVVIDDLKFAAPKTKEMAAILNALNLQNKTVLITTAALDANTYKSARNLQGVEVSSAADLNALSILKPHRMLVTKAALDGIKERAKPKTEAAPAAK